MPSGLIMVVAVRFMTRNGDTPGSRNFLEFNHRRGPPKGFGQRKGRKDGDKNKKEETDPNLLRYVWIVFGSSTVSDDDRDVDGRDASSVP